MSLGPSAAGGPRPVQPAQLTGASRAKPGMAAQAGQGKPAQNDKLMQACREFESLFLQQILQEARQGANAMAAEQPSFDRQVYEGWQDEQFARSMSGGGGIGLAESLYRQLSATLMQPTTPPAPAVKPEDPAK